MTTQELTRLAEIVGREHVQGEGLAREYQVQGRAPEAVAEPASMEEIQALVRLAAEADWPVVVWGGATQMSLGAPPERYRLAITTSRFHRVVDYQPDDMTVTVQAGLTLTSLGKTLAERGQFLPLDPPLPQRATAGGTVAAAASGPLRAACGTPRDWLLGAKVVDASGEIVSAGGRVVKNVAGYDLCKLYTGSLGTLGILGELTFKVMPRPVGWGYSVVATRDAGQAEALAAALLASDLQPAALELVNADAWETCAGATLQPERFLLVIVFAADEAAVDWQQAMLESQALEVGLRAYTAAPLQAEVWFRALRDYPARPGLVLRLSVPSSEVAALAERVEDLTEAQDLPAGIVAHLANGVLWVRIPQPPVDRVRDLVAALRSEATDLGGTAVVQRLPEGSQGRIDPWGPPPDGFDLMQGIKRALDPKSLLSPGRFVGGL